jgi:ribonucleoside-diphosphate reductase alpha chain
MFEPDFAEFHDDLAKSVLVNRYFWKDENGHPIEGWHDMCVRVARAVVMAEPEHLRDEYFERFFDLIYSGTFLPNSPVLMNFGQLGAMGSACFVLPIDDDMESIFDTLKHTALIHRDGGGTGFNFSRLRPVGARVKTNGKSSGVVSFMGVYNAAGMVIEQGGKRRGANMGMLNIDHPEIIKFIRCTEEDGKLANFNISIAITDEFMSAMLLDPDTIMTCRHESTGSCWLDHDGNWHHVLSESIPASAIRMGELFDMIVDHAWQNGEPGVFFIDRANEKNPVKHLGKIETTNPCGEYAAIPYSSCNLGSINLAQFVDDCNIDYDRLGEVVKLAVRFLDDVIDVNTYPIDEINDVTRSTRPVGLGVMGFADMLLKLGIRYGSDTSVRRAEDVMEFIDREAHAASVELATKRGMYPANKSLPQRNCQVTTIAPTGTISMLAGCSSGIEPIFSWGYERRAAGDIVTVKHPMITVDELRDPSLLPAHFVTTKDISVDEHIAIQAAFQEHCDNGVSKTINMQSSASREDVAEAIKKAWESGCNGITVYRDGSRANQVLEEKKAEPETITLPEPIYEDDDVVIPRGMIVDRPAITDGSTGRFRVGCGSLYVTYNHLNGIPCEVFVNASEHGGCAANNKALGMMISLALRAGVSHEDVVRTLKKVACPACRGKKGLDGKSCADAIANAMIQMHPECGYSVEMLDDYHVQDEARLGLEVIEPEPKGDILCPDCSAPLRYESGCVVCARCGYSKCS